MKRTILLAALISTPALAGPETDYPHRDWGQIATLAMPASDAVACIARELDKNGSVLVLPVDGGTDIDFSISGPLFMQNAGEPYMRFKVRESEGAVTMRAFYRRPLSQKSTDKTITGMEKRCLKVANKAPIGGA